MIAWYTRVQNLVFINIFRISHQIRVVKKCGVMGFYAVFRISSLLIPLVNLTDLCKKFVTRWHTCAKTCAKSTIFQICLYEAKLNGYNLNYIYNFRKFKLFPIVSVLLSSICVCSSYFPMQYYLNFPI